MAPNRVIGEGDERYTAYWNGSRSTLRFRGETRREDADSPWRSVGQGFPDYTGEDSAQVADVILPPDHEAMRSSEYPERTVILWSVGGKRVVWINLRRHEGSLEWCRLEAREEYWTPEAWKYVSKPIAPAACFVASNGMVWRSPPGEPLHVHVSGVGDVIVDPGQTLTLRPGQSGSVISKAIEVEVPIGVHQGPLVVGRDTTIRGQTAAGVVTPAAATIDANGSETMSTGDTKEDTKGGFTGLLAAAGATVVDESIEAGWRTAAKQIVRGGRDLLCISIKKAFRKPAHKPIVLSVTKALNSEPGEAMFGYALGWALEIKAGNNPKRQRIAREMRIGGTADGMNAVIDPIRTFLTSGVDAILNELPDIQVRDVGDDPALNRPSPAALFTGTVEKAAQAAEKVASSG